MSIDRAELETFWAEWIEANRNAQDAGDWAPMADLYAEHATYGWSYGPDEHFMAVGREEIRALALGQEMLGFDGWDYPYQSAVIDDHNGQVVGFWRQRARFVDNDGVRYEVPGLGCSWFQYAGNHEWAWQRDIFDAESAKDTVVRIIKDGKMSPTLQARIDMTLRGEVKAHYPLASISAPLWPVAEVTR